MQDEIVPRAERAAHPQEAAMLNFGTDGGTTVMGMGAVEWIFHGVIRGLDEPPVEEVVAQGGQLADLAKQPDSLRWGPAKRQAEPLAADDYAEGHIGHKAIDMG
ncbi:MAG: hypothetical protein ABJF10_22065 [Chthoniobacter sp.]|uniref:hypothetical protein n=1 Tax=Chthoniobacter sp. TaxID=2510640 RepID=UPI0032ACA66F